MMSLNMFGAYMAIILAATTSLVASYCPKERIQTIGHCSLRVFCTNEVRGVSLPNECRGSVNHLIDVDLILDNAIERYDDHIDREFLRAVTSFKVSATWPKTSLSLLAYMPRLRSLVLTGSQIETIHESPFSKLKNLQLLDLSWNSLTDIEDLFVFETKNMLKRLFLSNNVIEEIPGDTFSELTSLKELDLSHNRITNLDEDPFSNLTNLEILRLNNNRIKDLNGAVNSLLVNLKHLYLKGNQLQNIDEATLKIIPHLQTFDVSGNQLDNLEPIMFLRHWQHFGGVCKIILSENHITTVPNGTSKELSSRYISKELSSRYTRQLGHKVDVLTELDLSRNEITNIEYNAFQSIFQLTSLDLSNNKLSDFTIDTSDLKAIRFLNLSSNNLASIYFESFSSMVNLYNLDLSHNDLYYIPPETFVKNHNLKHVNMTFNSFKVFNTMPFRMFHPNGGILDLSNNCLSKIVTPLGEALHLSGLVLNSNDIEDAASVNLIYHSEMKFLEMNNNGIKSLNKTSLMLPFSLTYLDLSNNAIQDIGPSSFYRVSHLKSLNLGRNNLSEIQYGAFQGLLTLSNLDLSFNNIKYLDSKVLMDLKSLMILSLRSNGLYYLDYKGWLGHKFDVKVYLEGNEFTCEWLAEALKDYNNGYSRMRPTVQSYRVVSSMNSLEGIPCIQNESQKQVDLAMNVADDRLLVINQKILEAVREQNRFLRSFMNQFNHNLNVDYTIMMEKLLSKNVTNTVRRL